MNGEGTRPDVAHGVTPLEALVDPAVRAACRALARMSYPAKDLDALPSGEGASLVRALIQPEDLPLRSLRDALDRLDRRLQAPPPPPIYDSPTAPLAPVPELLAGDDPATRAARRVYRGLLHDAGTRGLSESQRLRLAFLRAHDFRALCEATMPVDRFTGPGRGAALHAWAQCYAREYLASSRTLGPSPCCDQAAQLARSLAQRAVDQGSLADTWSRDEDMGG